jgi:hypothetical protein
MLRVWLVTGIIACPALGYAEPAGCNNAAVVFLGRAKPPVTFHISGAAAIERARQNLKRVEEEVARERAALDLKTWYERNAEFEVRLIRAREELAAERAAYPPPVDFTFYPMDVEQAFRGVTESTILLLQRDSAFRLEPDEAYLITGHRSNHLVLPLPATADLTHLNDAVEAFSAERAESVPRQLEFLAATRSGATVSGTLKTQSYGEPPGQPLQGVRILVSVGGQTIQTMTTDDGSFVVSGIPSGRIELRPILPADLAVVNRSAMSFDLADGACHGVTLTVNINGRVRGRILSASGGSIKDTTLHLFSIDPAQFRQDPSIDVGSSHSPMLKQRVREDGTFEFFGVPAGTYLLVAWAPTRVDGKERVFTTYYPGTADRSYAQPINVGRATEHDGFDFIIRTD